MASQHTSTKKRCKKCFKNLKIHIICRRCDGIYHAKCLLRVPGAQVDKRGQTFCCLDITSKPEDAVENVAVRDSLEEVATAFNEDLENRLPEEKYLKVESVEGVILKEHHLDDKKRLVEESNGDGEIVREELKRRRPEDCERNDLRSTKDEAVKTYQCKDCKHSVHTRKALLRHACARKKPFESDKRYKCGECKYLTRNRANLAAHVRIHTEERPFKCDRCDFTTTWKHSLSRHTSERHGDKDTGTAMETKYKCVCCEYTTDYKSRLADHVLVHTNEKPFKCDECDYSACRQRDVNNHKSLRHATEENKHVCGTCKYSTHNRTGFERHMRTHLDPKDKPFKCDTCDYATIHEYWLKTHMKVKHSTEGKMYKCAECDYSGYQKKYLVNHMYVHTKEKPFGCDMCTYSTSRKYLLSMHKLAKHSDCSSVNVSTHANQNVYNCGIYNCKYSTHDITILKRHARIHFGPEEKQFKCAQCDYAGTLESSLKAHVRTKHSTKEKTHKCEECGYSTYNKSYLLRHLYVHTKEKPFECDMCEYTANRKYRLKMHKLMKHSDCTSVSMPTAESTMQANQSSFNDGCT